MSVNTGNRFSMHFLRSGPAQLQSPTLFQTMDLIVTLAWYRWRFRHHIFCNFKSRTVFQTVDLIVILGWYHWRLRHYICCNFKSRTVCETVDLIVILGWYPWRFRHHICYNFKSRTVFQRVDLIVILAWYRWRFPHHICCNFKLHTVFQAMDLIVIQFSMMSLEVPASCLFIMRRLIRNFNIPPPPGATPRAFELFKIGSFKFPPPPPPPPSQNYVQMPFPIARFICQMPVPKNKSFWWVVELLYVLCCSWNKSFASILPRSPRCDNLLSPGCKTGEVTGYKCYLQIYVLFDEGCCS